MAQCKILIVVSGSQLLLLPYFQGPVRPSSDIGTLIFKPPHFKTADWRDCPPATSLVRFRLRKKRRFSFLFSRPIYDVVEFDFVSYGQKTHSASR